MNGSTSLSFTVSNLNAGFSLTGVSFADALPAGLVVSAPSGITGVCGAGTITAAAGSSSLTLSGATLAPSASCTFSANVTGTTAGDKVNTTGAVSSTQSGAGATSFVATSYCQGVRDSQHRARICDHADFHHSESERVRGAHWTSGDRCSSFRFDCEYSCRAKRIVRWSSD
jgi:hypothetical protein